MLLRVIFLTVVCLEFANGQKKSKGYPVDTRTFWPNMNYWYSKWAYAEVAAVEVDGKNISKAPAGQHCFPPNDCWEVVPKKYNFYVTGPLKGDKAMVKLNLTKGNPITLLYKKGSGSCSCKTAGIKADYVQEVIECESILHGVIVDQEIKNVSVEGSIIKGEWTGVKPKLAYQEEDRVFFTGYLGLNPRNVVIYMKKGGKMYVTIAPQGELANPKPRLSIIDKDGKMTSR